MGDKADHRARQGEDGLCHRRLGELSNQGQSLIPGKIQGSSRATLTASVRHQTEYHLASDHLQ